MCKYLISFVVGVASGIAANFLYALLLSLLK